MYFRVVAFNLVLLLLASLTALAQESPDASEPQVFVEFRGLDVYVSPGTEVGGGFTTDFNDGQTWSFGFGLRLEHLLSATVIRDPEFMEPWQEPVEEMPVTSLLLRWFGLGWPEGWIHPYAGGAIGLLDLDTSNVFTLQGYGGLAIQLGSIRLYAERTATLPFTRHEIRGLDGYRIGLQYAWSYYALAREEYEEKKRQDAQAEARRRAAEARAALGTPFGDSGIYLEPGWSFRRESGYSPYWVSDYVTISGTLANRGTRTYRLMFIEADVYDDKGIIAKESTIVTDFGPGERRRFEILVYLPDVWVKDVKLRIRY